VRQLLTRVAEAVLLPDAPEQEPGAHWPLQQEQASRLEVEPQRILPRVQV
jgi:hypothetical protein